MHLARAFVAEYGECIGEVQGDRFRRFGGSSKCPQSLMELFEQRDIFDLCQELSTQAIDTFPLSHVQLLPPIDRQEVWAAGVTYRRSKTARMEESETSASCYDRVYAAARPELFLKATPHRVVGPNGCLRIRADASWNVPEPELTLVMNSHLEWIGATVGNDMSSRDIEGDNPLYLPQAKIYDACCGIGPWITLKRALPEPRDTRIKLQIERGAQIVFDDSTDIGQMARSFDELIHWLGREQSFPEGVFLMTGTGIIPPNEFTLEHGDRISITIDGIGTLCNTVEQRECEYQAPV